MILDCEYLTQNSFVTQNEFGQRTETNEIGHLSFVMQCIS